MKKFLLSLVVFSVILICSVFSVSAEGIYNDPDFEPIVSPSYSGPEQDGVVYFNHAIADDQLALVFEQDGSYYMVVYSFDYVSGYDNNDFTFWVNSYTLSSNSDWEGVVLSSQCLDSSLTSWTETFKKLSGSYNRVKYQIYNQDGSTGGSSGSYMLSSRFDYFTVLAGTPISFNANTSPLSVVRVFGVHNQFHGATDPIINNGLSMVNRNLYFSTSSHTTTKTSPVSVWDDEFYYCIPNSLGNGSYWSYAPDFGSGTAYVISGSSSGSITDENGNTYNTYNEYSFEMPDREFDGSISKPDVPTVPNSDINTIDFDITDFDAFSWVSDRLQELAYTNNVKIRLMFLSILSLGVIMIILNKRI